MAKRNRRAPTARQALGRIARLQGRRVPIRAEREQLDQPVDPDVQVTTTFPHHKFALRVAGQEGSSLIVWDLEQQIGAATVRMGGIGGVGTHPEHRFRGYARRVMESSLRWMRAEGFDVAMLYGIQTFYPKFGYAPAFPAVSFTMAVRDAEAVEASGCRFVPFRREHLRPVLRMYHGNIAGRTGPTRRDPRHWQPWRKGADYRTKGLCTVALDSRGRPIGYIVRDSGKQTATVIEVGFATRRVFPDILRAAARHALRQRLERIRLLLPEDDAFIEFCKPLGLRKEVTWRRDGGAMVRMIHIPRAFGKIAAVLASRLAGPGRLTLHTNLDDVGLSWSGGQMRVGPPHRDGPRARLPQWALAQLLYGYRGAEALAAEGIVKGTREAVAILAAMFPVIPHYHYLVDHF